MWLGYCDPPMSSLLVTLAAVINFVMNHVPVGTLHYDMNPYHLVVVCYVNLTSHHLTVSYQL